MKVAYDQQQHLVYLLNYQQALTLKQQKQNFFCPDCHQPLQIRITKNHHAFFAHYHRHQHHCNESQQHQTDKQLLLKWCQTANIIAQSEVWVCQQQQRADILLPHHQHIFELQCSPLDEHALFKRTALYHRYHYQIDWLLGKRYFLNKHYLTCQQHFINYHPFHGFYLIFLDSHTKKIWCYHHLRQYDWGKCFWQKQLLNLHQLHTKKFTTSNYQININQRRELQRQTKKIMHALHYQTTDIQALQLQCYQYQHHLVNLPAACYEITLIPPIFKKPLLFTNIATLLWLENNSSVTLASFYNYYSQHIIINAPLLDKHLKQVIIKKYANAFLKRLNQQQIIIFKDNQLIFNKKW